MFKRITSVLLTVFIVFSFCCLSLAENENIEEVNNEKSELSANAPSAVLVDRYTGMVLYRKNAGDRVYPADLTKIMTAVLVLENCKLEETAKASETALSNIPSGASPLLVKDEKLSVRQLLYAMMLASSSDAANVLAEKTSGSIEKFVSLMNDKAQELEMKNTNFTNPTGEHDERHYTTAEDMAKLAVYAMKLDDLREIVKCASYSIPSTDKYSSVRDIKTTNRLLKKENEYYYRYATGLKTGFTAEAKICIAASAQKDDISVIALVFGSERDDGYKDCKTMFDFVFENYVGQSVVKKGDIVAQTVVVNTRRNSKLILKTDMDVSVLKLKDGGEIKITYKDSIPEEVSAPVKANQIIGKREYYLDGELICAVNLIADKDYTLDPISFVVNKMIAFVTSPWLFVVIIIAFVLFVMYERRRRRIQRQKRREERANRRKIMEEEIEKL